MSEPVLVVVVPDISVAYVVVVVAVVVVVVVISLGTMVQFPVQHSSKEEKTQLASRTSNKKRKIKQLDIQKEDGGREEKRHVNQSSRTSEHATNGRVATAKRKRGGAVRVHSISPMDHINKN